MCAIANPDEVEQEMLVGADELAEKVRQEIRDLDDKTPKTEKGGRCRQQERPRPRPTRSSSSAEKKLEKLAGEFGMNARITVEKWLTKQNRGAKVKGRSASRTVVRGLELNEDFFSQKAASEQSEPYFGKLAQGLAASGKEIAKLSIEERSLAWILGGEIGEVQKLVEAKRTGKTKFDISEFAKENSKDARSLETMARIRRFHHRLEREARRRRQDTVQLQKARRSRQKLERPKGDRKAERHLRRRLGHGEGHDRRKAQGRQGRIEAVQRRLRNRQTAGTSLEADLDAMPGRRQVRRQHARQRRRPRQARQKVSCASLRSRVPSPRRRLRGSADWITALASLTTWPPASTSWTCNATGLSNRLLDLQGQRSEQPLRICDLRGRAEAKLVPLSASLVDCGSATVLSGLATQSHRNQATRPDFGRSARPSASCRPGCFDQAQKSEPGHR